MNYKLQLLQKEWELEHIREKKTLALQNMKYEKAARLRDVEKQLEQSVLETVKSLENYFNHTVMTDENYHELEEISKIIYYYGKQKNPLLMSKIETTVNNLEAERKKALSEYNFYANRHLLEKLNFFRGISKNN